MAMFDTIKKIVTDTYTSIESISSEKVEATAKKVKMVSKSISDFSTDTMEAASKLSSDVLYSVESFTKESIDGIGVTLDKINIWAETVPSTIHQYAKNFDKEEFWSKISSVVSKFGQDMLFMLLTLYYSVAETINTNKDEQKED